MDRRTFHLALLASASPIVHARRKPPAAAIDAIARIKALRTVAEAVEAAL